MKMDMFKAYRLAQGIVARQMPVEDQEALEQVGDSDIVVVRGQYDRVEDVLRLVGIPFQLVEPQAVAGLTLRPEQLLILNCPGTLDRRGITHVRQFVEEGGSLFSTDWALKHVIEPAFPNTVAFNQRPTADEVVRIEIRERDNPFLDGVFDENADPLWWLEGSSYPIRILDESRVKVLLTSNEIRDKYGEAPVAVTFGWKQGEVFHMISHYYLQRAETRTNRHQAPGSAYLAEKQVAMPAAMAAEYDAVSVGEVEAATTSLRLMSNVIARKARKNRE